MEGSKVARKPKTTAVSTIAVQSGNTRIVTALLQSSKKEVLCIAKSKLKMAAAIVRRTVLFVSKCLGNVCYNSNRASISKIKRLKYVKMYPTLLVLPNGSAITIRYHEPRMIIKLPPDFESMSEEEKKRYMKKQKPVEKIVIEEDLDDNFDAKQYLNLWKR